MAVHSKPYLTPQEYLAVERAAQERSEYADGVMVGMTGGNRNHNLIVGNVFGELRQQLKGQPCEVYASDLRVRVAETGLYTYPDVVVVRGEPRFEDEYVDTLLNPTLIVEVLSPSTESYDRGKKFEHYRTLGSLAEYLLVAQDEPRIERFLRQEGGLWLFGEAAGLDASLLLPSIGCELRLAEVYDKVRCPALAPAPASESPAPS
jgi:Uma2 family endonuclease